MSYIKNISTVMKQCRQNIAKAVLGIFILSHTVLCLSQDYYTFREKIHEDILLLEDNIFEVANPNVSTAFGTMYRKDASFFKIRLYTVDQYGNREYDFGKEKIGPLGFRAQVNLELRAIGSNGHPVPYYFLNNEVELVIENLAPEAVHYIDLVEGVHPAYTNANLKSIEVTVISVSIDNEDIRSSIGCEADYITDYAFCHEYRTMNGTCAPPNNLQTMVNGRTAAFSFNYNFPNAVYQVEVLKLNNYSEGYKDQKTIQTKYDWSKALRFEFTGRNEVYSSDVYSVINNRKEISMRIPEGTGYYIWRVRAIGAYYEGGIANKRNWGYWSKTAQPEVVSQQNITNPPGSIFYLEDPDEDKNWIFSRVFIEENKTKETMTYANGLMQSKQAQVYIPSQNSTLFSQTLYDKTGRPSLATLPAPIAGNVQNYKERVLNIGHKLYRDDDFDLGVGQASPADEDGAFSFYNGENPQSRVSDAQGYPFTRTTYYNDPLNRVKEQGGAGAIHTIKENGSGRTVKTYYLSPSEEELVRIFGKEAPNHEKVAKIVTTDQNDVSTVTYKTIEGNVIATCLLFNGQDQAALIDIDTRGDVIEQSFSETTSHNTAKEKGFVSSKKITLSIPTALKLNYRVRQGSLPLGCVDVDLADEIYTVNFYLRDMQSDEFYPIKKRELTLVGDYYQIDELSLPEDIDMEENPYGEVEIMPSGSYIVEKTLSVADLPTLDGSELAEALRLRTQPVVDYINNRLSVVRDEDELVGFYIWLFELYGSFNCSDGLSIEEKDEIDMLMPGFRQQYETVRADYQMFLINEDGEPMDFDDFPDEVPTHFLLKVPCCPGFLVPIVWVPPSPCDDEPLMEKTVETIIYKPDFEEIGQKYLGDCMVKFKEDDKNAQKLEIYDLMDGWNQPGVFNTMVNHMINERYTAPAGEVETPYTCDQMYDCWMSKLEYIRTKYCNDVELDDDEEETLSNKWDDQFDEQEEDDKDYDKNHDNTIDDEFDHLWDIIKWFVSRKISKEVRKKTDKPTDGTPPPVVLEAGEIHLVEEFLNCTGKKFKSILNPFIDYGDLAANNPDFSASLNCSKNNPNKTGTESNPQPLKVFQFFEWDKYLISMTKSGNEADYYYAPIKDWPYQIKKGTHDNLNNKTSLFEEKDLKERFRFIANPIYAYKYFQYDKIGQLNYAQLEADVCFEDPNNCYKVEMAENGGYYYNADNIEPCCGTDICYNDPVSGRDNLVADFCGTGSIICEKTHRDWTPGQNYAFYLKLISSFPMEFVDLSRQDGEPFRHWHMRIKEIMMERKGVDDFEELPGCELYTMDYRWYKNETAEGQAVDDAYANVVNEVEKDEIESNHAPIELEEWESWKEWPGYEGDSKITKSEILLTQKNDRCKTRCQERASEFRRALIDSLYSKCYIIRSCKGPDDDHIWPPEAVDQLVQVMVGRCQDQCNTTTFGCKDEGCRLLNTPKYITGANGVVLPTFYNGMGGITDGYAQCGPLDETFGGFRDEELKFRQYGNFFEMNMLPDAKFSWYEYTKHKQATEWSIQIELPDQCIDEETGLPRNKEQRFECDTENGGTWVNRKYYENPVGSEPDDPDTEEDDPDPVYSPHMKMKTIVEGE